MNVLALNLIEIIKLKTKFILKAHIMDTKRLFNN